MHRDDIIKKAWEKRSKIFKDKREGVLEQAFPPLLHSYIDALHMEEVSTVIPKRACFCLDIGCGYGRIASCISLKNPDAYIYGIDIAKTYVDLFNKKLQRYGKARVGDIRRLPFKNNMFDVIWVINTVMYLTDSDQLLAIKEIFRVLKPRGRVVIIEPHKIGYDIITLWGLLPFVYRTVLKKKKVETFGQKFANGKIDLLVKQAKGKIIQKRGYPTFTFLFLTAFFLAKVNTFLAKILLSLISRIDNKLPLSKYSFSVTYILGK